MLPGAPPAIGATLFPLSTRRFPRAFTAAYPELPFGSDPEDFRRGCTPAQLLIQIVIHGAESDAYRTVPSSSTGRAGAGGSASDLLLVWSMLRLNGCHTSLLKKIKSHVRDQLVAN